MTSEFTNPAKWLYSVEEESGPATGEGEAGYFGCHPGGAEEAPLFRCRVAEGVLHSDSETGCLVAIQYRHRLAGTPTCVGPGLFTFDGGRVVVRLVRI